MRKTVILDTNFIIALISPDPTYRKRALSLLDSFANYDLLIPEIVVFELIVGEKKGENLRGFCESISKSIISTQDPDFEYVRKIHYRTRSTLKANDCIILALCNRFNSKLLTFDERLRKVSKRLNSK